MLETSGGDFGGAYFRGIDRHFNGYDPLDCADDEAAIDKAKRLINKHGIEIWNGARLVMCLSPETK
ncbi:MAG: hypothetical protein QOG67_1994 [Verrucomicrobiota bacterium]